MPTCNVTAQINAPPQRVFELATDFDRVAEYISAIQSVEKITDGPVGVGTRFRETRIIMKREATEEMEITDFQPDADVPTWTLRGESCGAEFTTVQRFVGDSGGTRVELEMTARPVTLFAKIMSPLAALMMGSMRKCLVQDLDDLRRAAELQSATVHSA